MQTPAELNEVFALEEADKNRVTGGWDLLNFSYANSTNFITVIRGFLKNIALK